MLGLNPTVSCLVLSSPSAMEGRCPPWLAPHSPHACCILVPSTRPLPQSHAANKGSPVQDPRSYCPRPTLQMKGPWCKTHDPHHHTSSRNPLCPVSHLLCLPAWNPCCRHALRFTPLIASCMCPMAHCSYPCQTSPSQWHLRSFPITSRALDLQSAELAPDSPWEKTLTPNYHLPTAECLKSQPGALWSRSVEMEEPDLSPSLPAGQGWMGAKPMPVPGETITQL